MKACKSYDIPPLVEVYIYIDGYNVVPISETFHSTYIYIIYVFSTWPVFFSGFD